MHQMLEISFCQMLESADAVESVYLICLHDFFIDQLQLLLMLFSCVKFGTDCGPHVFVPLCVV